MLKKKIWANFQRIVEVFTQKFSICSQIYGVGSRDPEKTYPGSRIQGSKRHRIRIRNTVAWQASRITIPDPVPEPDLDPDPEKKTKSKKVKRKKNERPTFREKSCF
jgi:hypothetical protein